MFNKSIINELADSMETILADNKVAARTVKVAEAKKVPALDPKMAQALTQLTKVADYLNAAAEILDNAGMGAEAEVVTAVIELLANKEGNVDLRALIESSKSESVQLEKNLLETGTPFKFDGNDAADGNVKVETPKEDSNEASDGFSTEKSEKEELDVDQDGLSDLERKLDQDFEDTE